MPAWMKQACLPIGHHAGQGGCAPGTPHDRLRLDVTPETNEGQTCGEVCECCNRSAWPDCQVRDENRNCGAADDVDASGPRQRLRSDRLSRARPDHVLSALALRGPS